MHLGSDGRRDPIMSAIGYDSVPRCMSEQGFLVERHTETHELLAGPTSLKPVEAM